MRVVIVGGSFAGLAAARRLKKLLGERGRVSVIDGSARFEFRPSLPWLVFGHRRAEDISALRAPLFRAKGVRFVRETVEALDPKQNAVHTTKGTYNYDYLVLASGATTPPLQPPELAPRGFAPLWIQDGLRLRTALAQFAGGSVLVALHPRTPLTCPAYEFAFQLSAHMRRRGLRSRTSITMVSYEERPLPFSGPRASRVMARWLKEEGIRFMPNTFIQAVTNKAAVLADNHVLSAQLIMYIPPFRGADFLRTVPQLTDTEGFVLVDSHLRSLGYGNVFAAGDCVAQPGPKSALAAELQGETAATNIAADFGLAQHEKYTSVAGCLIDLGPGRGLLSVRKPAPQQGDTKTYFVLPGSVNRLAKVALEQYFLRRHLKV